MRTVEGFGKSNPLTSDQLLPLLHVVQQAHGCISNDALALIAETLNISRAEVFGVVSFYEDFLTELLGATVEICGAEACQALGCRSLITEATARFGAKVTVKEVFCLGNCTVGPSARIGDRVIGRATLRRIEVALEHSKADS